jgi:hypothetical protein
MLQQVVEKKWDFTVIFFYIAAIKLILWVKFVCSYYAIFDPFRNSCAYAYPHAILASLFHRWFECTEAQAPVDSE